MVSLLFPPTFIPTKEKYMFIVCSCFSIQIDYWQLLKVFSNLARQCPILWSLRSFPSGTGKVSLAYRNQTVFHYSQAFPHNTHSPIKWIWCTCQLQYSLSITHGLDFILRPRLTDKIMLDCTTFLPIIILQSQFKRIGWYFIYIN